MKSDYEQMHLTSDGNGGIVFYCSKRTCSQFGIRNCIHTKCDSLNDFIVFAALHIRDYHQELLE